MVYFSFPDDVVRDGEGNPVQPNKNWIYQNKIITTMTNNLKNICNRCGEEMEPIENGQYYCESCGNWSEDGVILEDPKPELIKIND